MSSFFGSGNGFLPPRSSARKSSGLGSPVQNVVATTAPQGQTVRDVTFGPAVVPSVSDQVAFQRSQLAQGSSGDTYGPKNMVMVQSYAPPASTPLITRPPKLPNENPLIAEFANQNAQTPEQEIQKVLAKDAGIAISSDALAKVIPIGRGKLAGLRGLGTLPDTGVSLLPETLEFVVARALLSLESPVTTRYFLDPAYRATLPTTFNSYITDAIDSKLPDAVAAVSRLEAIAQSAEKISAAELAEITAFIRNAIGQTAKLRAKNATKVRESGFSPENPPSPTDIDLITAAAKYALVKLSSFAVAKRPFANPAMQSDEAKQLGRWLLYGIDSNVGGLDAATKIINWALDGVSVAPYADVSAARTVVLDSITRSTEARRTRLGSTAAGFAALLPKLSPVNFGLLVRGLMKQEPALGFTKDFIQNAKDTIRAEWNARRDRFLVDLGRALDSAIRSLTAVVRSGEPAQVEDAAATAYVTLIPFADLVEGEYQKREVRWKEAAAARDAERIAAETAAAQRAAAEKAAADAAAEEKAAAEAAAQQPQSQPETSAPQALVVSPDVGTTDTSTSTQLTLIEPSPAPKSKTPMILLGLVAVLGVVYFVSKRQQSLGAAPLLLEDFDQ